MIFSTKSSIKLKSVLFESLMAEWHLTPKAILKNNHLRVQSDYRLQYTTSCCCCCWCAFFFCQAWRNGFHKSFAMGYLRLYFFLLLFGLCIHTCNFSFTHFTPKSFRFSHRPILDFCRKTAKEAILLQRNRHATRHFMLLLLYLLFSSLVLNLTLLIGFFLLTTVFL